MNLAKRMLAVSIFALAWGFLCAQVSSYPYVESFETSFSPGNNFLPNWWGNKMKPGVMGQYNEGRTGSHSLFMIPNEGEEVPVFVKVALDLTGKENTYASFYVRTIKNGTEEDRKRSRLMVAISFDGGATFGFTMQIESERGFPNENTPFTYYEYPFPPQAANNPNVVLRLLGKAGGGRHLPAILLIDDLDIRQADSDIFDPFLVGNVTPLGFNKIQINYSEPLLESQANNPQNYVFSWPTNGAGSTGHGNVLPKVVNAHFFNQGGQYFTKLTLQPPLVQGEYYDLAMNNVYDLNGNGDDLSTHKLVYNIPKPGDLTISEVFFADPSSAHGIHRLQYVEIFNSANYDVPLGGLRVKGAISAHDMPNVKLKPGEYYVITRQAPAFYQTFGFPAWEWRGSWIENEPHEGDPLDPQHLYIQTTDHHNAPYVDEIVMDLPASAWAPLNQDGYAIEVCDLRGNNNTASNWALAVDDDPEGTFTYTYEGQNFQLFGSPGRARLGNNECGNGQLVKVCHENQHGFMTMCIQLSNLDEHLAHGDYLGDCEGGCDNSSNRSLEEVLEDAQKMEIPAVTVFPNPTTDVCWISLHPDRGRIERIEVVNLMGQTVLVQDHLNHTNVKLTVAQWQKGIYFLRIKGQQIQETHKVTIE